MYASRDHIKSSMYELSARDRNGTVVSRLQNNWTTTLSLWIAEKEADAVLYIQGGGQQLRCLLLRQSDEMMGDHLYGRRHSLHTKHGEQEQ